MKKILLAVVSVCSLLLVGCNSDAEIRSSLSSQQQELKDYHRVVGKLPDGRELHYTAVTYMTQGDSRWHHIYYVGGDVSINSLRTQGKVQVSEVQVSLSQDEKELLKKITEKITEK